MRGFFVLVFGVWIFCFCLGIWIFVFGVWIGFLFLFRSLVFCFGVWILVSGFGFLFWSLFFCFGVWILGFKDYRIWFSQKKKKKMWWQTGSLKDLYSVLLQLPEFKSKVKQTEEEFLNFLPDRFPYNASTRSKLFSAVCASTVTSQNVMSQMPSQKPSLERAKAKTKTAPRLVTSHLTKKKINSNSIQIKKTLSNNTQHNRCKAVVS